MILETNESKRSGKNRHRMIVRVGLWVIKRVERLLARQSLVGNSPFLDNAAFPWTQMLEANWRAVRRELEAVMADPQRLPSFQEISPDQVNLTRDDRWKTFFLYGYGYKMSGNCACCPETTQLVESIPGMMTAFFSILSAGKCIPPHRGPYKGVVRCHLALMVPEPRQRCRIQVDGQGAYWQEGRCLVFDDTYKHAVQNDTDGIRVVLFLDVRRPLAFPASSLNRVLLTLIRWSPFIQDARRRQRTWERRWGDC